MSSTKFIVIQPYSRKTKWKYTSLLSHSIEEKVNTQTGNYNIIELTKTQRSVEKEHREQLAHVVKVHRLQRPEEY